KELAELQKKGFQRVKINGQFYEIAQAPKLDKQYKHDIDVVVDRIVVRGNIATRLADSLETALELADGIAVAEFADRPLASAPQLGGGQEGGRQEASARKGEGQAGRMVRNRNETHERIIFSARFACPVSGFTIDEVEPRLFSFNAPAGACPKCDGLGTEMRFEAELVVPDASLSLKGGSVYPWARTRTPSAYYDQPLEGLPPPFT